MAFDGRIVQTNSLIGVVHRLVAANPELARRIHIVSSGYEERTPEIVKALLRFNRTDTAKFIRFMPDCFVVDGSLPTAVYMLDYKVTQTPLYSTSRLHSISTKAGLPLIWQNVGQMEADAYDSYRLLGKALARVAVINYCAYHPRLLLCDYVENIRVVHRDVVTTSSHSGSRTPFVNFDCNSLRTLAEFIKKEHGLVLDNGTYENAIRELKSLLPTTHAAGSPYGPGRQV